MPLRVILITLLLSVCLLPARAQVQPHLTIPQDLSGMWRFVLDRNDEGVNQQWYSVRLPGFIRLPGVLQAQNQGDEITTKTPWVLSLYDRFWYLREDYKDYTERNVKVPFLSQPPRHYLGVAWYQREIFIQPNWAGRRVVLTLERPHWETTVWLDNKKIGSERSLVAPHVFDFGAVTPGRHQLTIRVDNRMIMPYRPDAHSVSDSLAASWNGITGKMQLSSTGRVWIEDAQVFPRLAQKTLLIKVRIGNQTGLSGSGTLTAVWPDIGVVPVSWDDTGGTAEVEVPIRQDAVKWDEFHPQLYPLRLWLKGNGVDENLELNIGLREFKAEGKEFQLNGRAIIFRGTHHGGDFPLTGYSPTDVAYWKKLFELCRSWGLNHMRFHSWCPPEAAFEAADSLGFYLQPEPGMWNEISPDTPMERMLYEETEWMIKAYGNHPSFMLLSASNEPKGNWRPALAKWADTFRKKDPRRLYTRGTGHTERQIENVTEGSDFLAIQRIGPKMLRRESGWFGGDYDESLEDINIPVISHEIGQWCAYPDFDVIKKFTASGYMRPGNYEIFRDSLKAHGLLEKNKDFAQASGRFQVAVYKEEIEANLRTRGLSGFQLLDLHDYLGQGTALVGLLDPFWEPKGYVKAEEFKDFCNTTVPLARLQKYVFIGTERLEVPVEVAHYGAEPMEDGKGVWRIDDSFVGEWDAKTIPIGKNIELGNVSFDLSKLKPGEHKLTVTLAPSTFFAPITRRIVPRREAVRGSTYFENSWTFRVYPPPEVTARMSTDPPLGSLCEKSRVADVLVTNSWEEAEAKLASGGKVLFSPRSNDLDWSSPPLDVVPIFWNRQMVPSWGRMLGLWIKRNSGRTKDHMIDGFSTSEHFDWQWAEIVRGARAINMDRLPEELEPVVWAIDDWNRNYKLGILFEGGIGNGKLLVSAIDVTREDDTNPVLAQLRRSLLMYMKSDCFQPSVGVTQGEIRSLLFDTRIMAKLGAKAEVEGAPAGSAIDGDPTTFILVGDQRAPAREQVELMITFREPVAMSGVLLISRQNHREHEGDIREFVVQASDDGKVWSDIARGELLSTFAPQRVEFSRVNTARYLKLISLSGFGTDKTTALAEIAVIYAGPKLPQ